MRRIEAVGSRWRPAVRVAAVLALAAAGFWLAGFAYFVRITEAPAEAPRVHADGIVALTGGPGRVELALHLLANGRADRLLITGIGGGTELGTLGQLAGVDTAPLASRITLGRYAASTRGNGVETAAWAEQNKIRTLIVVTAGYHMPRALAELHQALPTVQLLPAPVRAKSAARQEPIDEGGAGLRLKASEYVKYLLTISGLSEWFPRRETALVPRTKA